MNAAFAPSSGPHSATDTASVTNERADHSLILTINGGSSSLKFGLFDQTNLSARLLSGRIERIGSVKAHWVLCWTKGPREEVRPVDAPNQKAGIDLLIDWLAHEIGLSRITAIGHRIVHGGSRFSQPERVTDALIDELRRISPWDPDHLPGEIELIEAAQRRFPNLLQVACFDTAFHHDMPRVAQIVPIPRRFESMGVRRYGFHGLSYTYLLEELARVAGPDEAQGQVILAHLGAGASLAAVRGGQSLDTTMGFTPASGLMMGTRSGDFDPGLVRFLQRTAGLTTDQFDDLVNHQSGLIGVSETSSDTRDLLRRQSEDVRAAEAIALFCYQAKKGIGSFAAALGGLQTLVFAGGIGENSSEIRRRICEGLEFLGIVLDDTRNDSNATLISTETSPVKVRVIGTDEERMIARSVAIMLETAANSGALT